MGLTHRCGAAASGVLAALPSAPAALRISWGGELRPSAGAQHGTSFSHTESFSTKRKERNGELSGRTALPALPALAGDAPAPASCVTQTNGFHNPWPT